MVQALGRCETVTLPFHHLTILTAGGRAAPGRARRRNRTRDYAPYRHHMLRRPFAVERVRLRCQRAKAHILDEME
jgi:hypothetical protein